MNKNTKKVYGSCLCEDLQVKFFLPVNWCNNCHCTRCQQGHGSGFVTWVAFKKDNFSIVKGKELLQWYYTSKKSEFGFCSKCGSSILYRSKKCPDEVHITLANIVDDLNITPQTDNYFDTHIPWLKFDESIPKKDDPKLDN